MAAQRAEDGAARAALAADARAGLAATLTGMGSLSCGEQAGPLDRADRRRAEALQQAVHAMPAALEAEIGARLGVAAGFNLRRLAPPEGRQRVMPASASCRPGVSGRTTCGWRRTARP